MTGKTDNEPANEASARSAATKLADKLNRAIDAFVAEDHKPDDVEKVARIAYVLARAFVQVQAAQAAEDKAQDRAIERKAKQAAAAVRARYNPDEGDETEMDEGSSAAAESLDAVRARVERRFETMEGWLRADAGDRADGAGSPRSGPELVRKCAGETASSAC